jgi:hypothetical protein
LLGFSGRANGYISAFFSFRIVEVTPLTQTGNRRGKAVEEHGKKRGRQQRRYNRHRHHRLARPFFFELFAAVQIITHLLPETSLQYFLC